MPCGRCTTGPCTDHNTSRFTRIASGPSEAQLNLRLAAFEIQPLAVELVLVRIVRIDRQNIDVGQIRIVDRVRPTEMRPEPVQDERRTREHAARQVPALLGLQPHLVPRQRPRIGLMRIDQQAA